MPPLIIAVVAAVATYGAAAAVTGAVIAGITIGATAAAIIGAVVGSIVSIGLGMILQGTAAKPKVPDLASDSAAVKQTIRGSIEPHRIVYGEQKVGGVLVYAASGGANEGDLHMVVVLAAHSVQSITTLWINDDPIDPSEIIDGTVRSGKFADRASFGLYNGTQNTADPGLIAESPDGWDASHQLLGLTYLRVKLNYDPKLYQGVPTIAALVKGKNDILDPRSNGRGYTSNWALVILDYLKADFGLACADDEIDLPSFIAAANLSDEAVPLNAAGTVLQSRYILNGVVTLDQTPLDVIEGMLSAGGGALVYVAGKYRLHGGAYVYPSASLSEPDFAGPVELQTLPPRSELFNSVRGVFIDPARYWQASEFPPLQDPTSLAEDGEEIWRDVELKWITDPDRAQRLARQILYRQRSPLTVKAQLRYASIQFSVWQTIAVSLADFGWSAKPFRLTSFTFNPADGTCSVTLTEEQVAAYAWYYDQAIAVPDSPNTTLIDPLVIPAPTALALSASTILQADGTVAPGILASWEASLHAFVDAHEVQWRLASDTVWSSRDVAMPTLQYLIAPTVAGASYFIRVRGIAGLVRGPFTVTGSVVGGADTTPPAVPSGLATVGILRGISITWNLPADRDLAAVEVYAGTDLTTGTRAYVGETLASGFVINGLAPAAVRYVWVRSRDRSGNRSAFAGPVFGRASLLLTTDLEDAIINTAKFASGIEPITVIPPGSANPTTKSTETIYSRDDKKLYRWDPTAAGGAGAYVRSVDAADVIGTLGTANLDASRLLGQLGSTQYAAGSITASKLSIVPTSLNADPYFQDAASWTATAGGWIFQTRATSNPIDALNVPAGITLPATFTNTGLFQVTGNNRIAVTPGDRLTMRMKGRNAGNRAIIAFIGYLDKAGAYLGGSNVISYAPGDAAQYKELQDVAPAAAATCYLTFYVVAGAAWTGTASLSDVVIVKPSTAAMLVDGSVTAQKLSAANVFGDSGVFNALKAGIGSFGGLTSTEIAAGEIKAVNLSSGQLLSLSAQIGSLVVDTFAIGGDAVTSHASALVNSPTIYGNGSIANIIQYSINVPYQRNGAPQDRDGWIMGQFNNGYTSAKTHYAQLYLNGALLTQTGSSQIVDWPLIMSPATFHSGGNVVALIWWGEDANIFVGTRMLTTFMRVK